MRPTTVVLALVAAVSVHAAEGEAGFVTERHVYERCTPCTVELAVPGASRVTFDIDGWFEQEVAPADGRAAYSIDTAKLRAGDYMVRARVGGDDGDQVLLFPLSITKTHDSERLPVWSWGGGSSNPEWWMERGFTGAFMASLRDPYAKGSSTADRIQGALDRAARAGFSEGFYLRSDSTALKDKQELHVILPNGERGDKLCLLEPGVIDYMSSATESWLARYHDHPGLRHVMLNSEWQTPLHVNQPVLDLAAKELGLDITEFMEPGGRVASPGKYAPRNGIIEDDNPRYRFLQWWWQRGHGTAVINQRQGEIVKKHNPALITWHEPYRLAPVRGSHKGLDCIATWTYGNPDIKRLCYTTFLQGAARPEQQLVQQDITLFVYGRFVMPLDDSTAKLSHDFAGRDPYFTAGPDYAREAMWLVLSQRPDILCFYAAGRLLPDKPAQDPHIASPETFNAIGEVCDALVKPFGPTIRACRRATPRTAVLMSAASSWFRDSPSLAGYPNEQGLPYASLLMMTHTPFEVLLDEDLGEGALERYDILVMPKADTLTRTMYDRICVFAKNGGTVLADTSLRVDIPGAVVTDFDFTYQRRIDGRNIPKGDAVTAEEHRAIMEGYAAKLSPLVAGATRWAAADTPRVLTNTLEGGGARYHFFVNDNRTYGPRFGQWKLRFELGVPQYAKGRIAIDGAPALYDALLRKPIEYESEDGWAAFPISLPAARGMLVAALPEAIDSVSATAPAKAEPGEAVDVGIQVLGASGKPLPCVLPVHVRVYGPAGRRSEWQRFTCTDAEGQAGFTFIPAVNDPDGAWRVVVTDLIAGKTAEVSVAVTHGGAGNR